MLDDSKRQTILALLSNGSRRRIAARFVRCAPSTITRTADRDPEFAEQLARAEQNLELCNNMKRRCVRQLLHVVARKWWDSHRSARFTCAVLKLSMGRLKTSGTPPRDFRSARKSGRTLVSKMIELPVA